VVCDGRFVKRFVVMMALGACAEPRLSIDDYPDAWLEASCELRVRCNAEDSVESCRSTRLPFELDARLIGAVDAGRVRWHGDAAEDCIEKIGLATCDTTSESYRYLHCQPAFSGTLGNGEACTLSTECISRECWTEGCTEACCVGYCAGDTVPVVGELGEPCRLSGCVAGTRCENSVCVPLRAEGDACMWDDECAYDLGCGSQQRCESLAFSGERCNTQVDCRMVGEICGPQGTCEVTGTPGDPCLQDSHCGARFVCHTDGRCAPGPAVGQPCSFNRVCFDLGAYCDETTDLCSLPQADGAACTFSGECESAYCFDGACASCGG
jgi:hypothetical protein